MTSKNDATDAVPSNCRSISILFPICGACISWLLNSANSRVATAYDHCIAAITETELPPD